MRYLISVALFVTFTSLASGQSKVTSHSGSVFVGETKVSTWPLKTSFGQLNIPIEEIRGIEFGLHYDEGVKEGIVKAIRALSSAVYKEREIAQKDLIQYGKYSVPFLTGKSDDMEVVLRQKAILEQIMANSPKTYVAYDIIRTNEGDLRGEIQLSELEVTHPDYGSVKLKLSALSSVLTGLKRANTFEMKPATEWKDSGINFEWGMKMSIRAEGKVELWPQGPGQYIATPDGYNTAGRGGIGMAGQLMVKVGESGTPMSLKVFNEATNLQRAGPLMFLIVPNPWNTPSEGSYTVTIKGD